MSRLTGLWTIAGTVAALSLATIAAGCTQDATGQDRPTRVVCIENGRIVLDDFVKLGASPTVSSSSVSYMSETQQGRVYAVGQCFTRPYSKPKDWKPVFPG